MHIPAGIGVLEAVFIRATETGHTSKGTIIAALLVPWRSIAFIPLLLALICYLLLESGRRSYRRKKMKRRCEV